VVATLPLVWANRKQGANGSVVSAAKKILVLNAESKKLFAEAGWPNQKMEVLPNFIPDNLADYSARVSSRQGKSSWIYAGRFSEEKGILELLEDWPASQKLRLAGDGPQLKQVLELAKSNTAIEYLGKISREQVIAEIARSKGLIFPSIWMEGLALTCIEATSVGCPIIARRGNAAASAVLAHNLGAVYDKGIDLGDALAQVEQRSSYFGNSAREYYERTFSEPAWTSNILRVYKDATNE
jgi:glycosyltransferase involved in cell wall biosynthesis